MKTLVRLELRKQCKTFLGLLFIIVMCLTVVTASISTFAGLQLGETFLSITVMLQAFGIPFFALLLGAGAGSALRGADRKAEEDIPVRSTKRALAAYIVSLFYLIILVVTLFLASRPFQYSSFLQTDYKILFIMLALLPLHSAAFVFSYWLSQALLGSIFAVIATATPVYWLLQNTNKSQRFDSAIGNLVIVVAYYFSPSLIYRHWNWIQVASSFAPAVITTAVNLLFLVWLIKRTELERKIWLPIKIAAVTFLLSVFSLTIWCIYFSGTIFGMTSKELNDTYYLGESSDHDKCNCP